ncbi:MAG: ATP-binding protein [Ignavibacteriaceae bacterium]|nr:ATP-binding protein [Ignavibacteriaceae bacterium]
MKLSFDPRLLTEIIGKGQYTQFRSILSEYIANAYDAEADRVDIIIPEDFTTDPIIITDNGKGLTDIEHFKFVGENIQLKKTYTPNYSRKMLGRKGIGRFAGFACAQKIIFESNNGEQYFKITFDREELLKQTKLENIDIPSVEKPSTENCGTKVTLDFLDSNYTIPNVQQIGRDIVIDFNFIDDFKIFVNNELCEPTLIKGEVIRIDEITTEFGHVSGTIIVSTSPSKKMKPGVIIRVKNRRVEGPSFFGIEEDYSSKVMNRMYGDINADGLEDIISSGREGFIQHDERYKQLIEWLKSKITIIIEKFEEDTTIHPEEIIYNLPRFKKKIQTFPTHLQTTAKNYIKNISHKLSRIKNDKDLLEIFGLLILRACENADFHSVLDELERTENMDISTLAKVLKNWSFGEIAYASSLVQNRLKILDRFSILINEKATPELQGVHSILESNTWILDDRYSLFTSNKGIRTILSKLSQKYEGKKGRKRPDLILKRDREDFVLIELKAPDIIISMVDVTQILEYQNELQKQFPEMRDCDLYVIGKDYDEISRKQYPEGNQQKIHLLSLNMISQRAEDRLRWLSINLKEEYDSIEEQMVEVDLLPESKIAVAE